MSLYPALFSFLPQKKPYVIVKLSYGYVISFHVILDVKIKKPYHKRAVLLCCHIQLTFALVFKRSKTRYKLEMSESLARKIRIYLFDMLRSIPRSYGQDIELHVDDVLIPGEHGRFLIHGLHTALLDMIEWWKDKPQEEIK